MEQFFKIKDGHSPAIQEQDGAAFDALHASVNSRILLVEDDPGNLLVASVLLETFGYQYDTATSGNEAVEKAGQNFYPVIIMDMKMPDLCGKQTTSLIRENERKLGRRPSKILCVTANALIGERERCLAAEMDDYLSKPYMLEDLQHKLSALFAKIGENP